VSHLSATFLFASSGSATIRCEIAADTACLFWWSGQLACPDDRRPREVAWGYANPFATSCALERIRAHPDNELSGPPERSRLGDRRASSGVPDNLLVPMAGGHGRSLGDMPILSRPPVRSKGFERTRTTSCPGHQRSQLGERRASFWWSAGDRRSNQNLPTASHHSSRPDARCSDDAWPPARPALARSS
jgi:hypothetical protein